VIFNRDQILPRYIVYYHRKSTFMSNISLPLLLWVEDKPYNIDNQFLLKQIQTVNSNIQLHQFNTTVEFRVWLQNHNASLTTFINAKKIRIITNRNRKEDGELAGQNLIDSLKKEKHYHKIPILLFCRNINVVAHMHNPKKLTFVSCDMNDAIKFGSFTSSDEKCIIN